MENYKMSTDQLEYELNKVKGSTGKEIYKVLRNIRNSIQTIVYLKNPDLDFLEGCKNIYKIKIDAYKIVVIDDYFESEITVKLRKKCFLFFKKIGTIKVYTFSEGYSNYNFKGDYEKVMLVLKDMKEKIDIKIQILQDKKRMEKELKEELKEKTKHEKLQRELEKLTYDQDKFNFIKEA